MENSFEPDERPATGTEPLAACFYKLRQSLWEDGRWKCPHCAEANPEADITCSCGFARNNLEEFANKHVFSVAKLVIALAF